MQYTTRYAGSLPLGQRRLHWRLVGVFDISPRKSSALLPQTFDIAPRKFTMRDLPEFPLP